MELKVGDAVYTAEFDRQNIDLTATNRGGKIHQQYVCAIHLGKCVREGDKKICLVKPIGVGVSTCSKKDQFVKKTGRKIAFTRAIMTFPRELRAQLWADYLKQEKIVA